MWVLTKGGRFISLVEKPWDREADTLTIRARVKSDLTDLFPGCKPITTKNSDYAHRIQVPREQAAEVIAQAVRAIDYDNYKGTAPADRHNALMRCWTALLTLQSAPRRRQRAKDHTEDWLNDPGDRWWDRD